MEHTNRLLVQVVLSISLSLEYQYTKSFLETTPISLFPIIGLKKPFTYFRHVRKMINCKNTFSCLFSVHNIISLSRQEQLCGYVCDNYVIM